MRTNPARDAQLRQRLQEAVDAAGGGSADAFGRLLGYMNGGYVREALTGKKPVREALVERVHRVKGMEGWFAACLPEPAPSALSGPQLTADEAKLLRAFRDLPPKRAAGRLADLIAEAEEFRQYAAIVMQREAPPQTVATATSPMPRPQDRRQGGQYVPKRFDLDKPAPATAPQQQHKKES